MEDKIVVKHGLFDDFKHTFASGVPSCVISINTHECLVCTKRELLRIEKKLIKDRFPISLCTICQLQDSPIIIGITAQTYEFYIFNVYEIDNPVVTKMPTKHQGVMHVFYLPKSQVILTVGYGIVAWQLYFDDPEGVIYWKHPAIRVVRLSSFCLQYEPKILYPPSVDYENELIYLPSSKGIIPYGIDGHPSTLGSKFEVDHTTVYSFDEHTKRLVTCDQRNGILVWKAGTIVKQMTAPGNAIFFIAFVNQETLICYNAQNIFLFVNINTQSIFNVFRCDHQIMRIFYIGQNQIAVSYSNVLQFLEVSIPWNSWSLGQRNIIKLDRCPKIGEAARIMATCSNSEVRIFTPRADFLAFATPLAVATPICYYYDRGLVMYGGAPLMTTDTDILTIISDNGMLEQIRLCRGHSRTIKTVTLKCSEYITRVKYQGEWMLAISTTEGEFFICDDLTFTPVTRFRLIQKPLYGMRYLADQNVLVFVFAGEVVVFSLLKNRITDRSEQPTSKVLDSCRDMVVVGTAKGIIAITYITNGKIVQTLMNRPHYAEVTGFSFSQTFWVSCGLDGNVFFYDYTAMVLAQVELPLPLHAIAVLNGHRDIIVATEGDIMVLNISDGVDEADENLDNFDQIIDEIFYGDIDFEEYTLTPAPSFVSTPKPSLLSVRRQQLAEAVKTAAKIPPQPSMNTITNEERLKAIEDMKTITSQISTTFKPLPKPAEPQEKRRSIRATLSTASLMSVSSTASIPAVAAQESEQPETKLKKKKKKSLDIEAFMQGALEAEPKPKKAVPDKKAKDKAPKPTEKHVISLEDAKKNAMDGLRRLSSIKKQQEQKTAVPQQTQKLSDDEVIIEYVEPKTRKKKKKHANTINMPRNDDDHPRPRSSRRGSLKGNAPDILPDTRPKQSTLTASTPVTARRQAQNAPRFKPAGLRDMSMSQEEFARRLHQIENQPNVREHQQPTSRDYPLPTGHDNQFTSTRNIPQRKGRNVTRTTSEDLSSPNITDMISIPDNPMGFIPIPPKRRTLDLEDMTMRLRDEIDVATVKRSHSNRSSRLGSYSNRSSRLGSHSNHVLDIYTTQSSEEHPDVNIAAIEELLPASHVEAEPETNVIYLRATEPTPFPTAPETVVTPLVIIPDEPPPPPQQRRSHQPIRKPLYCPKKVSDPDSLAQSVGAKFADVLVEPVAYAKNTKKRRFSEAKGMPFRIRPLNINDLIRVTHLERT